MGDYNPTISLIFPLDFYLVSTLFLGLIYAQHAMKKEKITPTVIPTTVLPQKRDKGRITVYGTTYIWIFVRIC